MNIDKSIQLPIIFTNDRFVFPECEMVIDFTEWPGDYRKVALDTIALGSSELCGGQVIIGYYPKEFDVSKVEPVGIIAKVRNYRFLSNDILRVNFQGVGRARVEKIEKVEEVYLASYSQVPETRMVTPALQSRLLVLSQLIRKINFNRAQFWHRIPTSASDHLMASEPDCLIVDYVAQYFRFENSFKIELIQEVSLAKRLEMVITALRRFDLENEVEDELNSEVRKRMDQAQREYVLREKMKVIREQLGDGNDRDKDIEDLKKLIESNPYPTRIKEKARDELNRYELMPGSSSEASVIRNYLDWLLKTPWYQESTEPVDFKDVEETLHANHYGLDKPKERILEYLAVREFAKKTKAPIICFSGPPGIGKTSLAKSIAQALKKEFVKISLGGVHDEAEIRGHRRTYLGSMPGRIIQAMKKAGVVNPVFLLDEIDKIASDYRGDPSSALLEVLDPEQNQFFSDHYLEEAYDLSKVLFITTANYLDSISPPLRDRLEIINLSSYTEIEKLNIAKIHLIPRQADDAGIAKGEIKFSEDALLHIIRYYTREAGVRQLERQVGTICRKSVVRRLKGEVTESPQLINVEKVREYLGKERFDYTRKEKVDQVGVVTGLAYTEFGGDILQIEVSHFEGKGKLILTGSLGDVMKESAEIAIDFIRSNASKYGIDPTFFEKNDVHIHAPEGATPKDGPSAGVTMTVGLISSLTGRKVRSEIAMTGEITLRGNVLAIGGLKEKSIAAHRSGIRKIFIPRENEKDIDDIPIQVRSELEIVLTDTVDDILEAAIVADSPIS